MKFDIFQRLSTGPGTQRVGLGLSDDGHPAWKGCLAGTVQNLATIVVCRGVVCSEN